MSEEAAEQAAAGSVGYRKPSDEEMAWTARLRTQLEDLPPEVAEVELELRTAPPRNFTIYDWQGDERWPGAQHMVRLWSATKGVVVRASFKSDPSEPGGDGQSTLVFPCAEGWQCFEKRWSQSDYMHGSKRTDDFWARDVLGTEGEFCTVLYDTSIRRAAIFGLLAPYARWTYGEIVDRVAEVFDLEDRAYWASCLDNILREEYRQRPGFVRALLAPFRHELDPRPEPFYWLAGLYGRAREGREFLGYFERMREHFEECHTFIWAAH